MLRFLSYIFSRAGPIPSAFVQHQQGHAKRKSKEKQKRDHQDRKTKRAARKKNSKRTLARPRLRKRIDSKIHARGGARGAPSLGRGARLVAPRAPVRTWRSGTSTKKYLKCALKECGFLSKNKKRDRKKVKKKSTKSPGPPRHIVVVHQVSFLRVGISGSVLPRTGHRSPQNRTLVASLRSFCSRPVCTPVSISHTVWAIPTEADVPT